MRKTTLSWALVTMAASGCNEGKSNRPISRREAVAASSGAAEKAQNPPPRKTVKLHRTPRTLCKGPSLNKEFPSGKVGHGEAPGVQALGTTIRVGHGRWVWLNLWAAWCAPCKEELPRLQAWQKQLSSTTDFRYLSLDDDRRQFLRFLQGQPADGLRSSYWLPEGKPRTEWLEDLGIDLSPELPMQILVNPRGKVTCIIQGAVEDEDLARVRQIVGTR